MYNRENQYWTIIIKSIKYFFIFFLTCNLFANELNLTAEEKAYLKQHTTLNVMNLNTFPPFSFNENGKPLGYSVDYMKLMGKYMGVNIKFISNKPWSEYLAMLKDKTLDIIPHIAVTSERKKFIDFTNFNHVYYTTGIAVKKDSNIGSMDDLKNKIIAVANKTFLHTHLKNEFPNQSLLLTSSTSKAVEAVSLGQADAVIGSLPALNYYIQQNWFSDVKTLNINDLGISTKTKLPMGVSKNNHILKSILEKTNNVMSFNEVRQLKEKWMDIKVSDKTKIILNNEEISYLKNKKNINLCIDPNWMPLEKIEKGIHTGITSDYIKRFQKQLPIPINIIPTKNWTQSLKYGKQKKCDIFTIMMKTDERKKYYDFTDPYLYTPLVIATKIDTPFVNHIQNITDKKIGIVKNYEYYILLRKKYPNMKLIEIENVQEGLRKVEEEELFGFVGSLFTIGYYIQKNYAGELKIGGKFQEDWGFTMATRNDEPLLNGIFNKFIQTIPPKIHKDILNKWIAIKYQKSIDYTTLLLISLFFTIIILLILYKNRSIKSINNKLSIANSEVQEQQNMVDKYVLIMNTDLEGIITNANEAYCKSIGYLKEELVGHTHEKIRHPSMNQEFFMNMWDTIKANKIWAGEITNYTKQKDIKYFNVYIEPVLKSNIKVGYRAIYVDITDKKRIEELSITDKLTGIYNRLKLDEMMQIKVEKYKRYNFPFSIILIDVDNFKNINDTYGHDEGDWILQELSKILKKQVRITDIVGRWGGEEFLIICANTNLDNTFIVAEYLRIAVENTKFNNLYDLTISLGIAEFCKNDTPSSIFKKADKALYEAKNSGKNKTVKMI